MLMLTEGSHIVSTNLAMLLLQVMLLTRGGFAKRIAKYHCHPLKPWRDYITLERERFWYYLLHLSSDITWVSPGNRFFLLRWNGKLIQNVNYVSVLVLDNNPGITMLIKRDFYITWALGITPLERLVTTLVFGDDYWYSVRRVGRLVVEGLTLDAPSIRHNFIHHSLSLTILIYLYPPFTHQDLSDFFFSLESMKMLCWFLTALVMGSSFALADIQVQTTFPKWLMLLSNSCQQLTKNIPTLIPSQHS